MDSIYCNKIGPISLGRRKSWLVPVQLLIGALMFSTANLCQNLINNSQSKTDITILTLVFIIFNTLAATQDIAVGNIFFQLLLPNN